MTDDPRLTRSAIPLVLYDGDEELNYTIIPFSDSDYISFNAWLRQEYMRRLEESLKYSSKDFALTVIATAASKVPEISCFDGNHGQRLFASVDGLAHALTLCIKEPIEKSTLIRLLGDRRNEAEATKVWSDSNLGEIDEDSPNEGESSAESSDTDS